MKIYAGVIAYNEELLIEASLRSIYEHVDEIIVIDGSPQGPSTDSTAKIAASLGPKVKVISGTFKNLTGVDHKLIQRSAYLDRMEKLYDDWCIVHDADEVWDEENIQRLVAHLRNAPKETLLFSYQWIHLFVDCWHFIHGGEWDRPRDLGAFRLVPGISYLNHHRVGMDRRDSRINFGSQPAPVHTILGDVKFFHYGHAQTREKVEAKVHFYFDRDIKCRAGYSANDWERYRKEYFIPWYESRLALPNVLKYEGSHPSYVQNLVDGFWKKNE